MSIAWTGNWYSVVLAEQLEVHFGVPVCVFLPVAECSAKRTALLLELAWEFPPQRRVAIPHHGVSSSQDTPVVLPRPVFAGTTPDQYSFFSLYGPHQLIQ